MFYDPIERKLHDYVGGKADLDKGIIRAIGNPHERFLEDRLRMMRAVRYSTRFNFPIEKATVEAIVAHAHSLLPAVAVLPLRLELWVELLLVRLKLELSLLAELFFLHLALFRIKQQALV